LWDELWVGHSVEVMVYSMVVWLVELMDSAKVAWKGGWKVFEKVVTTGAGSVAVMVASTVTE